MKKTAWILVLFLSLNLLVPQTIFADAAIDFYPSDSYVSYYVQVDAWDGGCNFRYGPGVSYSKIISGMIPNGTVLYVSREASASNGNPWGYVQYGGAYGWIALSETSFVGYTYTPSSGNPGSSASSASWHVPEHVSYDVTASAYDGQLNIRRGPGVGYDRLTDSPIPNGTYLHIYWEDVASNGNSWGFTNYNGTYGWVALTQTSGETRTKSDTLTVSYRVTVDAPDGGVNFRSGPGTEYSTLISTMIPNDTTLQVTSETRNSSGKFWGQVSYNGKTGWITMQQVEPIPESASSTSTYSYGAVGSRQKLSTSARTASVAGSGMDFSLLLTLAVLGAVVLAGAGAAGFALYKRKQRP